MTDSPPDAEMRGIPNRSWRRRCRKDPAAVRENRLEVARAKRFEYREEYNAAERERYRLRALLAGKPYRPRKSRLSTGEGQR
jgi:hypothetical protein